MRSAKAIRKLICIFLIELLLCSTALAINSNGTGGGDWDAGASWNGGVAPVNGDTAVVLSGDNIAMNEDMSGWANGVTLQIINGGTLSVPVGAGTYYFLTSADIDCDGTIQAGTSRAVPLPFAAKFTIDFNGGSNSIVGTNGVVNLYCTQPTNRMIALSGLEASGQTELSVDTDVTADIWADGDTIRIDDDTGVDSEEKVIAGGGIAAGAITITAALAAEKTAGAKVVLCTRNITITNSTDYAFIYCDNSTIDAHIDTTNGLRYCDETEMGGVLNGTATGFRDSLQPTMSGNCTDCTNAINICQNVLISGNVTGSNYMLLSATGGTVTGSCFGGTYPLFKSYSINLINSTIKGASRGMYSCTDIVGSGCTFDNTANIYESMQKGNFYNCTFTGTEFSGYNGNTRPAWAYAQSQDHDGVTDAFVAWPHGGKVLSQTASPPSGYTVWYEHTCEDADYPCYRQFSVAVLAGETFEAVGKIRIADADDMSGDPPFLAIVDQFDDPLVRSAASYLDQDFIPIDDGTETGWQDTSVRWTNSGNTPRYVYLRMQAQHASAVVDEVIGVSSLLVGIGTDTDEIINRLKRIGPYP